MGNAESPAWCSFQQRSSSLQCKDATGHVQTPLFAAWLETTVGDALRDALCFSP